MPHEIERKWLCNGWAPNCEQIGEWLIEQSYLYVDTNIEVRLRKKQELDGTKISYVFSVKFGEGISRTELETHISEQKYHSFLEAIPNISPIIKQYRQYKYGDYTLEMSIVDGDWMYAEIEFDSLEEANKFKLPFDWEEVTGNPYYNMKNYWVRKQKQI